ncbi:MAG: hydrogenase small subunit [Phycisphaerae bacterium]
MKLTRRDVLKAASAITGAVGLSASGLWRLEETLAASPDTPPLIWLQAQACSGCTDSLLDSIYYSTIDQLLFNVLDMEFHPTLMAAAGQRAVDALKAASEKPHILVIEGAIPTAAGGKYCTVWSGTTALQAAWDLSRNALAVVAAGTCASFGGMSAGRPNRTGASGVQTVIKDKQVINVPGCPVHPDWLVGVVAYLLKYGKPPALNALGRPLTYFRTKVHENCPRQEFFLEGKFAERLGEKQCMRHLGCRGPEASADCPKRQWNSPAALKFGVNWCIAANAPCIACTEPNFPDGVSPFYNLDGTATGATSKAKPTPPDSTTHATQPTTQPAGGGAVTGATPRGGQLPGGAVTGATPRGGQVSIGTNTGATPRGGAPAGTGVTVTGATPRGGQAGGTGTSGGSTAVTGATPKGQTPAGTGAGANPGGKVTSGATPRTATASPGQSNTGVTTVTGATARPSGTAGGTATTGSPTGTPTTGATPRPSGSTTPAAPTGKPAGAPTTGATPKPSGGSTPPKPTPRPHQSTGGGASPSPTPKPNQLTGGKPNRSDDGGRRSDSGSRSGGGSRQGDSGRQRTSGGRRH